MLCLLAHLHILLLIRSILADGLIVQPQHLNTVQLIVELDLLKTVAEHFIGGIDDQNEGTASYQNDNSLLSGIGIGALAYVAYVDHTLNTPNSLLNGLIVGSIVGLYWVIGILVVRYSTKNASTTTSTYLFMAISGIVLMLLVVCIFLVGNYLTRELLNLGIWLMVSGWMIFAALYSQNRSKA